MLSSAYMLIHITCGLSKNKYDHLGGHTVVKREVIYATHATLWGLTWGLQRLKL